MMIEEKVIKKIKLITYRLFKQNFNFEPYLIMLNFKQRQALTKLRIGNHRLEIELGRHKHIKAADRICKICKDGVEDEPHFLFKCKNFENIRKPYLETIYTLCPNLKTCDNENICIWIIIVYKSILNHCMKLTVIILLFGAS